VNKKLHLFRFVSIHTRGLCQWSMGRGVTPQTTPLILLYCRAFGARPPRIKSCRIRPWVYTQ